MVRTRVRSTIGLAAVGALILMLACASRALASSSWWRLESRAAPSLLAPGGEGWVMAAAQDLGDAGVDGRTRALTITDRLPAGLTVASIGKVHASSSNTEYAEQQQAWSCSLPQAQEVRCANNEISLPPYGRVQLEIPVKVETPQGSEKALENEVTVQGGESEGAPAPSASLVRPLRISAQTVPFGVEEDGYAVIPEEEGGAVDARAGSHPFQLTSSFDLNQTIGPFYDELGEPPTQQPAAPALPRNLEFALPPGLLGNVQATEQCSETAFSTILSGAVNLCPAGSAVGVATVTLTVFPIGYTTQIVPLFSLEPGPGEPARFGFEVEHVTVILDTALRTGGDYGVSVKVMNADDAGQVLGTRVTFWGEPDDQTHDSSRGWECLLGGVYDETLQLPCNPPSPRKQTALLTLPSSCTGALLTSVNGESWPVTEVAEPPPGHPLVLPEARYTFQNQLAEPLAALEHCAELPPFEPSLGVGAIDAQEPEHASQTSPPTPTHTASSPTGLTVNVKIPQQGIVESQGSAIADLEETKVKLPEGVTLNPSAANGLQACSEQQIGYQGPPGEPDPLEPGAAQPLSFSEAPADCPPASTLGTVQIRTPLLDEELSGHVYLAGPAPDGETGKNPFDNLIAIYLVAESEKLGLHVKLAGKGELDEQTGQLTTVFANTPQVPLEELHVRLFGGPRGSLGTPPFCGSYPTQATFTPWSGQPPFTTLSNPLLEGQEFTITSGPGEGPCPSRPLPFQPSFQAGVSNPQAGALTPFTLTVGQADGSQPLEKIDLQLPPGIAALIANVTPCPEAQALTDTCGAESLVGHTTAVAGLGDEPVTLGGQVYLVGALKATSTHPAAPFGLLALTRAQAGPFDLGWVPVLSTIEIDPSTAAVSVRSEPIPKFVRGVPVDLKQLQVSVERPGNAPFEFNPTSCEPHTITGSLSGYEGTNTGISYPFQVQACASLPFHPALAASVGGKASKAGGAGFTVKVTSQGLGVANIQKVDLQLPKQLPARLTTIQKACVAAVFEANPAACDEGSVIGFATIHTPVFKNPLIGPAYLVSHGNAGFPDVEFVLQGEGVKIVLDGKTDIKDGITYSKFENAPDAPFTTFETVLPAGPHSALTANVAEKKKYSLCGEKLQMPTTIVAQNGAVIQQSTHIALAGCAQVKGAKAEHLTFTQALARCRTRYRHSEASRARCQRKVRAEYTSRAINACRHEHRHSHRGRASCERAARARYATTGHRGRKR